MLKRMPVAVLVLLIIVATVVVAWFGVFDGCRQHDGSPVEVNKTEDAGAGDKLSKTESAPRVVIPPLSITQDEYDYFKKSMERAPITVPCAHPCPERFGSICKLEIS